MSKYTKEEPDHPPADGVNFEEGPEEVTIGQLEKWLGVRKLRLRITFEPGKSGLPLARQIKKKMADFDLARGH
mgnify:CR=1 FL=1